MEEIYQKLLGIAPLDIRVLNREDVPRHKGIYLWREKDSEKIVYVGTALGKNGLRHRIISQHLNPNYIDFKNRNRERSVLRKAIVEDMNLPVGQGCVKWMKEHLTLSF